MYDPLITLLFNRYIDDRVMVRDHIQFPTEVESSNQITVFFSVKDSVSTKHDLHFLNQDHSLSG